MFVLRTLLAASALAFTSVAAFEHEHGATEVHRNMGRQLVPVVPGILNLNPNILSGGGQVINLNVVPGLLGASNCTSQNKVVGVTAQVNLLGVATLNVCSCVAIGASGSGAHACPSCPANASPTCGSANCGCTCNSGFYAYTDPTTKKQLCAATSGCAAPSTLVQLSNGRSSCVCSRGFIDNLLGGCISACLI
ncbi:hypothetical protein P7C70_g5333, partial [Phenoliferia sp. Uapishka_3]